MLAVGDIADAQRDQITATQLAVDGQIEQRQIEGPISHPKDRARNNLGNF